LQLVTVLLRLVTSQHYSLTVYYSYYRSYLHLSVGTNGSMVTGYLLDILSVGNALNADRNLVSGR
jgi:hypothetical protein